GRERPDQQDLHEPVRKAHRRLRDWKVRLMATHDHLRHFQEELEQLKTRLLEMGGLAEEQVRLAMQGLVDRDRDLLDRVLTPDGPVNALHIEIATAGFTL